MKTVVNYLICTVALCVAIVLTCSGGWWTLAGLCYDAMLYLSGVLFPKFWKTFWITNARILAYFDCL